MLSAIAPDGQESWVGDVQLVLQCCLKARKARLDLAGKIHRKPYQKHETAACTQAAAFVGVLSIGLMSLSLTARRAEAVYTDLLLASTHGHYHYRQHDEGNVNYQTIQATRLTIHELASQPRNCRTTLDGMTPEIEAKNRMWAESPPDVWHAERNYSPRHQMHGERITDALTIHPISKRFIREY